MSTNQPAPPYGTLFGPLYFATVLSTALYGVTCMQTFFYYIHYQGDPLRKKSLVVVLWALNTVHEALTVAAYKSVMADLLDPRSLLDGTPELILQTLFTALVAVITQGFFVHRIYLFSNKNVAAPLVWAILAIVHFVPATIYVGKALYSAGGLHAVKLNLLNKNPFMSLATLSLSVAAGVDILIAIFLTFLLVRTQTTTGYSSTVHVLQRLTVFSVNTGIWTALFAVLSLILLHVFPSNMIYATFVFPLCSVYCNTLLANLNARAYVRGETAPCNVDMDLFATSSRSRASAIAKPDSRRSEAELVAPVRQSVGVWKTTEVVTFTDASAERVRV